ncbi:hypothetical protein JHK87_011922 [Glycine soja]|nr:hypothetical protein JHK87_011922 [Glycine soja]
MVSIISNLLENKSFDQYTKACLKDCFDLYSDSLSALDEAVVGFKSKDLDTAAINLSATFDNSVTCEDQFKDKKGETSSPLTMENRVYFQLNEVVEVLGVVVLLQLLRWWVIEDGEEKRSKEKTNPTPSYFPRALFFASSSSSSSSSLLLLHDREYNFFKFFVQLLCDRDTVCLCDEILDSAVTNQNVNQKLIDLFEAMFFTELYAFETRKLVERLINYVIYKCNILELQLSRKPPSTPWPVSLAVPPVMFAFWVFRSWSESCLAYHRELLQSSLQLISPPLFQALLSCVEYSSSEIRHTCEDMKVLTAQAKE